MPNYIIDPTRFYAQGAVVEWLTVMRRLGMQTEGLKFQPMVQLRWTLRGDLGLPTEPFQVWARAHNVQVEKPLNLQQQSLMLFFNYSLITWSNGSMSHVSVDVQAPSGGAILAFAGGPLLSNVNAIVNLPTGNTTVSLAAPVIDGLLVSPSVTVTAVRGIETGTLAQMADWTLIEVVGLPVTKVAWNGIGMHGDPQGLVGAFVDAPTAAIDRLKRGAPPIGWAPTIVSSIAAPLWSAPDFGSLVGEVNGVVLNRLRNIIAGFPPNQQMAQKIVQPIPPPQNSSGETMTVDSSSAQVSPLAMMMMGANADPFLSLVLGFGTAYPFTSEAATVGLMVSLPKFDYMITAHWEKGLDGNSDPIDFAAIIPAPSLALPPIPPANLMTTPLGQLRPLVSDGNWRSSTRISWDRPPDLQLFQNASFAVARIGLTPAESVVSLMEKRVSGGLRPIVINNNATTSPPDPLAWQLHAIDRELPIPSDLGSRSVKYATAVQDIYGQWTPWMSIDTSMAQPDPEQVRIVSAKLIPAPPASGSVCATTLEIEFLWDWRIRRPQLIRFAGHLYAASEQGSPPPSLVVPAGLNRSLGGGGGFLELNFAGDTPSAPGATILALNEGGDQQVTFGAAQGNESRRYRLRLPGFSLDFGLSGHIGLALWAQCQERIVPNRTSVWSDNPCVIATADPRPPIIPIDRVTLSSLPDAVGQCHARIAWTAKPEAIGYFIYESDETQILNARGLPEPTPDQTLDDRLLVLKNAFNTHPEALRRNFTRLNATAFTGTSRDVTLPKGSTAIHLYIVLGTSAGQVEGHWPSGMNAEELLIAIAAPHIMNPWLEVRQYLDQTAVPPVFKAALQITTRPGPRVKKIDLHRVRVDDAAKELDTMGPPIARFQTSGGGWTITQTVDTHGNNFIQSASGIDAPPGSWRRVWYRAAAWTDQDDTRGGLPGRSPASTAAWVVIPPPDSPTISPLALGTGSTAADVIVQWTSTAPLKRTPLGPHTLSVRATRVGEEIGTRPLLSLDSSLDNLGITPPITGSGVWIVSSTPTLVTYRALIRRAAISDSVRSIVRITDPIGRMGEALTTIVAGSVNPPPDLFGLQLHKVAIPPPLKVFLEFKSNAPLEPSLDGSYKVRVTVVRKSPAFPPQPPVILELTLASVPVNPPASPVPLGLYRLRGSGSTITYIAVTSLPVTQFIVGITAPDGQSVQQTQPVS
jgi:hypothetical protein